MIGSLQKCVFSVDELKPVYILWKHAASVIGDNVPSITEFILGLGAGGLHL